MFSTTPPASNPDYVDSLRRAAAIQSVFATAKLNGIDPARWLADTLEKLPACPNSKIYSLLPFATLHSIKR